MYRSEYYYDEISHDGGNDLPCSVCRSIVEFNVLMIPGKSSCYNGWSMQYHGDHVAGYNNNEAATQYICLDEHSETVIGGQRTDYRILFSP